MMMSSTAATAKMEASATSTTPEEIGKNVIHVHMIEAAVASTLAFALLMLADSFLTLLIVYSALVRVRKRLVGVSYLLELSLGCFGVVLILVRVILDGKLLEGFLDLLF